MALSYGAVEVTPAEANAYDSLIADYLAIAKETDLALKRIRTVEWLVKLAENPLTRRDRASELIDRKSLLGKEVPTQYGDMLTSSQIERMKVAVLKAADISGGDRAILKLIATNDPHAGAPVPRAETSESSEYLDSYRTLFYAYARAPLRSDKMSVRFGSESVTAFVGIRI